MHELSIAQGMVDAVSGHPAAGRGGRIVGVTVRVGALSGVDPRALAFAFGPATAGTPLAGASLTIEEVGPAVFCPRCRRERELPGIQRLRCPVCRTPTPQIVRGRELEILSLELEEETEDRGARAGAADPSPPGTHDRAATI